MINPHTKTAGRARRPSQPVLSVVEGSRRDAIVEAVSPPPDATSVAPFCNFRPNARTKFTGSFADRLQPRREDGPDGPQYGLRQQRQPNATVRTLFLLRKDRAGAEQ